MMRPATATVTRVASKLFRLRLAPLGAHCGNRVRGRELVGVSRLSQLLNLGQLFLAQIKKIPLKL